MNIKVYFHRGADEIITPHIINEVKEVVGKVGIRLTRKSAPKVRNAILAALQTRGWSKKVQISSENKISLTSVKQQIGLCLQTGNMARFYADLLKLQLQFNTKKIRSAFYILANKSAATKMGSNMACFERLTSELDMFQDIITIPILVIGFEED